MRDTMILLPLSAKYYVVFYQGRKPEFIRENKFNVINDNVVEKLNSIILQNSYVKCVGKKQEALEKVKDSDLSIHSPTKCIMTYDDGTIKDFIVKREVFWYGEDKDLNINSIQYISDYLQKIKGKIGRNSPCICQSGKKYKYCCQKNMIWLRIFI